MVEERISNSVVGVGMFVVLAVAVAMDVECGCGCGCGCVCCCLWTPDPQISNADINFRCDATMDQLIDVIEGNR